MARRYGLREVKVHWGMFDYEAMVVIGPKDRLADYLGYQFEVPAKDLAGEVGDDFRAKIFHREGMASVIWLPDVRTPDQVAALAHEMFHAVTKMMDHFGLTLSDESDEAYAHALSFGVRSVLESTPRTKGKGSCAR